VSLDRTLSFEQICKLIPVNYGGACRSAFYWYSWYS